MTLTENQIKHMVSRFLAWRLPENFNPDAGISFKATFNEHTPWPMKHNPSGTNLFDAVQAEAMVRHIIEGMPSDGSYTQREAMQLAIDYLKETKHGSPARSASHNARLVLEDALAAEPIPQAVEPVSWEDIQDIIDKWAKDELPGEDASEARGCITSWSDLIAQAIVANIRAFATLNQVVTPTDPEDYALLEQFHKEVWGWLRKRGLVDPNEDEWPGFKHVIEEHEAEIEAAAIRKSEAEAADLRKALETARVRLHLIGAWLQRNHGTHEVNGVSCAVGVDEIDHALTGGGGNA